MPYEVSVNTDYTGAEALLVYSRLRLWLGDDVAAVSQPPTTNLVSWSLAFYEQTHCIMEELCMDYMDIGST